MWHLFKVLPFLISTTLSFSWRMEITRPSFLSTLRPSLLSGESMNPNHLSWSPVLLSFPAQGGHSGRDHFRSTGYSIWRYNSTQTKQYNNLRRRNRIFKVQMRLNNLIVKKKSSCIFIFYIHNGAFLYVHF